MELTLFVDHDCNRPPRVSFGMNTNGTRFDARALRLLAPPRRWTTFVSLDGPADIHDTHRRRPGIGRS